MPQAIFQLSDQPFDTAKIGHDLIKPGSGAYVTLEGWVRDNHNGKAVISLSYLAHPLLALTEGDRIMRDALHQFAINGARCVHRIGALHLSELAVWVGVSAGHRDAAFNDTCFIIDEIKARAPIWKHEHYSNGRTDMAAPKPCD